MTKNKMGLGLFAVLAVLAVLSSMSVSIARAEDQSADQNAIQAVDQATGVSQDTATDVNADALALFLGCTRDHFSCQQLARHNGFGWYRVFREYRCGRWHYACYGE